MNLSRKSPRKQSDLVPQGKQTHDTGDDPQPAPSGTTPSPGGTIGHSSPVPCTFSLLITDLTRDDLAVLLACLEGTLPANDCALAAPWAPETSALLDWLTLVEDDAGTLIDHLRQFKRAIEEIAL